MKINQIQIPILATQMEALPKSNIKINNYN